MYWEWLKPLEDTGIERLQELQALDAPRLHRIMCVTKQAASELDLRLPLWKGETGGFLPRVSDKKHTPGSSNKN